jgi:hypothetical protein
MDFPIFTKAGPTRIARQLANVPVEIARRKRSLTSSGVRYSGSVIFYLKPSLGWDDRVRE